MKVCPITYEAINDTESYSKRGLYLLSPHLKQLQPLPLSAIELQQEALQRSVKMSIQGVQPKLSAVLKSKEGRFEIVDTGGRFILKMPNPLYPGMPANEAISMTLAKTIGLNVPLHGLVYGCDGELTYFIKRFDRGVKNGKFNVEDFSQLNQLSRETKYEGSMEQIIASINQYCTFPKIEHLSLFRLTLFNFLIGNEDMHLKNFSVITRDETVTLSPVYDLLNSTILLKHAKEELALPLQGKKSNITKKTFFEYFAKERLGLTEASIATVLHLFAKEIPHWERLIGVSFMTDSMKEKYINLVYERARRMGLMG